MLFSNFICCGTVKMGCWDIYCFICGCPCHEYDNNMAEDDEQPNKKLIKQTRWMDKCVMLLVTNEVIFNCKEVSCNVMFRSGNEMYEHDTGNVFLSKDKCGIFLHSDCWKYVARTVGIKLKYSDVPVVRSKSSSYQKTLSFVNYGTIENYYEQFFAFSRIAKDKKTYLCSSPLVNDKNIKQINKNIKQLKLKSGARVGPSVSATFYKEGTIKQGNDGYFWKVSHGKWMRINTKPIKKQISTPAAKNINKLPFVGEINTVPMFVVEINKKNMTLLTLN